MYEESSQTTKRDKGAARRRQKPQGQANIRCTASTIRHCRAWTTTSPPKMVLCGDTQGRLSWNRLRISREVALRTTSHVSRSWQKNARGSTASTTNKDSAQRDRGASPHPQGWPRPRHNDILCGRGFMGSATVLPQRNVTLYYEKSSPRTLVEYP